MNTLQSISFLLLALAGITAACTRSSTDHIFEAEDHLEAPRNLSFACTTSALSDGLTRKVRFAIRDVDGVVPTLVSNDSSASSPFDVGGDAISVEPSSFVLQELNIGTVIERDPNVLVIRGDNGGLFTPMLSLYKSTGYVAGEFRALDGARRVIDHQAHLTCVVTDLEQSGEPVVKDAGVDVGAPDGASTIMACTTGFGAVPCPGGLRCVVPPFAPTGTCEK